jgi:hypothetical protein
MKGTAMRQIDAIEIRGTQKRIELWQGDLTEWPEDTEIDALVVSAFRGDYAETEGSLIGALDRKGVSVRALAERKDVDVVDQYSCWLSTPLTARPGIPYRHILCFEPSAGKAPNLVGDVFRALVPIAQSRSDLRSVAMPILAAGDQQFPIDDMLPTILDAGIRWLEMGSSLERIVIVTHSDEQAAQATTLFAHCRESYQTTVPLPAPAFEYDVFVSYSHANTALVAPLVEKLRERGLRVFFDQVELNAGAAWQLKIFESLSRSRRVVALISPEYLTSKVCQEEFNMAWMLARSANERVLLPVYAYTASLPVWVQYWQYVDCREGDHARLDLAVQQVLNALKEDTKHGAWNAGGAPWATTPSRPTAPANPVADTGDRIPCPRCAESIKRAARMCRFCFMELLPPSA